MGINTRMTGRDWSLLLVLSVLWGGSFFFVGVAVTGLPHLTIVALRAGGAALALWLWLVLRGQAMPRQAGVWAAFAVMGFLNNVIPFTAFVWAQAQIPSGAASILNATTPLFGVLVAGAVLRDEPMSGWRLLGVLIGLSGVALAVGPEALSGLGGQVLPELACLGAALSYACAGSFGRRFRAMGIDPVATSAGQLTCSSLLLVPLALVVERPWALPWPGWGVVAAVAALALVSTGFAYILYFRLLASAGATNILLVTLLIPVTAILLGALFLGESLGLRDLAGLGLIGLGLSVIDGRLWRRA